MRYYVTRCSKKNQDVIQKWTITSTNRYSAHAMWLWWQWFVSHIRRILFSVLLLSSHKHLCAIRSNLVLLIDNSLETNVIALPFSLLTWHKNASQQSHFDLMWIQWEKLYMLKNYCVHINYFERALVKSKSRSRFYSHSRSLSWNSTLMLKLCTNWCQWILNFSCKTQNALKVICISKLHFSFVFYAQRPCLFRIFVTLPVYWHWFSRSCNGKCKERFHL